MGIFDWLLGGKDPFAAQADSVTTRAGKAAYQLAAEISESRDLPKWKRMMDLYYKTADPEAKVEVLRMAASLAKVVKIDEWKREVKQKTKELQGRGYM